MGRNASGAAAKPLQESRTQWALPLPTWPWALGSSGREAPQLGACISDSLAFMLLRLPCSPQASQSLGRLSSWPAIKQLSKVSKGQDTTCNGATVLRRVWRREGATFRRPSPALVRKLHLTPAPLEGWRKTQVKERKHHRDALARLPMAPSWFFMLIQPPSLFWVIVSYVFVVKQWYLF